MEKIINVSKFECPIDRMVDIQNNGGLPKTILLSENCFETLRSSADSVTEKKGKISLFWKGTDEFAETKLVARRCKESLIFKPQYEIMLVQADDIHFEGASQINIHRCILKEEHELLFK